MDIGFETIGNAILLCHDRRPVLVTDPWLSGNAYFGSWTFSHEIPQEQFSSIAAAEYAWISHGHPDHLNLGGLRRLSAKRILLPDHVGGRIASFLGQQGYAVVVLRDRRWYKLSDRIRVMSVADYNQDAILLVDVNGRLVVNLNDATDRGWRGLVRRIAKPYDASILMCLSGLGDADMINIYDDDGEVILPPAAGGEPVGRKIAGMTTRYGVTHFVPFSSMHRYQRRDSIWANQYTTRLDDYSVGFDSRRSTLLPAFIRYDCARDSFKTIAPPERPWAVRDPQEFGDDWTDQLEPSDAQQVAAYFKSISHLEKHFDFLNLRVGGRDNVVSLAKRRFGRGITFEVPRTSLMTAIEHEIFDDLLIGNFMKTTVHGSDSPRALYPDFTPYVAKYADNGQARTEEELRTYFREYRKRAPFDYLHHRLERRAKDVVRSVLHTDSALYRITRGAYRRLRGW